MNRVLLFIEEKFKLIVLGFLLVLFFRTCDSDARILAKRVESLSQKVEELQKTQVTKTDLTIEGLKTEKRMIQSTDRRILDVTRQAEIDKELKNLEVQK